MSGPDMEVYLPLRLRADRYMSKVWPLIGNSTRLKLINGCIRMLRSMV
jgi:hypothetical protein